MAQPIGLKAVMDVKDFSKGQKAYENGLSSMQGKTEKTTKGLSSLLKGAGAVALGVFGAKMIQGVVKNVKEMVSAAAEIPGVASAFEGLGGSIEKMREGSLGMVTDIDLMKSFNSAAQLVSTDFAQKLPDAMGYLSKVSAATGQDMGFMVDSLVKGVGRLSPMILDNLGIQVNATEANEAYAKQLGKSATELTKTEQQTAMMNLVMEKLAANTAAMPDILGTTNQQLASMKAMSQNLKNEIGKGLQPVMGALLAPVLKLGMFALPMVGKAAEKTGKWVAGALTKGIETATGAVEDILSLLSEFKGGFDAGGGGLQGVLWGIGEALDNFIPEDAMNKIWDVFDGIQLVADKIKAIPASFAMGKMGMTGGGGAITGGLAAVLGMLGLPPDIVGSFAEAGTLVESTIRTTLDKIKTGFASGGVGGVFDALLPAGGDTATMLAPILDPLRSLGTEVQRVITEGLAAFDAEGVKGVFNSVLGNAFDLLGVFTKSKNDLIGGLMTLGGTLLTTLGEAFPELQPIIDTFLKPALEIGKRIFDAIIMVKGQVTQAALGLFTSLTEDAPAALAVLPETINSILTTAIGLFETLFPVILDVINAVIPVALAIVETMAPVFATAFEVVGNIVADVMPVVSDIIGQAAAFIEERMPQIAQIIQTTLEVIQALWNAVWPVLQTVIEEVWPVIEEVVGTALDFLQGILNTVLLLIKGDFIGAFDSLKETITDLAQNIEDVLITAIQAIWDICEPLGVFLKNVFVGAWEAVQLIIGKLVDKELGRAKEWIDKVRDSIEKAEEWCGKIAGGFERIAGKLEDLISPIKTAIDWLSKLKVPDVLKPGSPSPFEVSLVGIGQALKSTGKMFAEFAMGMSGTQAKNFKEVTKGVNELVGAFADLLDLMVRLNAQPTGMDMTGLTAFLGKFENAIYAVMGVVDRLLNSIGYKRLKLLDKAAKYFKQIFDNVLINFKDISTAPVPDMNTFKENIIAVGVAIVQALQGMVAITGQNSLNQAARFAEIAEEVFAFIKSAIDVLKDMADYDLTVSMEAKVANMLDRLWEIVPPFVLFAQRFAGIALETANSIYASMTGIVSFIKPALDGIIELAEYELRESVADQIDNMLARVGEIVPALVLFAGTLEQDALDAANEIYRAMTGIFSFIKAGIDALKLLAEYRPLLILRSNIIAFRAVVVDVALTLADIADVTQRQMLEAAGDFFSAASKVFAIINSGIAAIKALSEYRPLLIWRSTVIAFRAVIVDVATILADIANVAETDMLEAAGDWYDFAGRVIGFVADGINVLKALAEYRPISVVLGGVAQFRDAVQAIVGVLSDISGVTALDMVTAAGTWYEAAQKVMSIIQSGLTALAALAKYAGTQFAVDAISSFQRDLLFLVNELAAGAEDWAIDGVTAAGTWFEAANKVISIVTSALDVLKKIALYTGTRFVANAIENFQRDMLHVVNTLAAGAEDWETTGVEAAATWFGSAQNVLGIVKTALDAIVALVAYQSNLSLSRRLDLFKADLKLVIAKLVEIANDWAGVGLDAAVEFSETVAKIIVYVQPALSTMQALFDARQMRLEAAMVIFQYNVWKMIDGLIDISYDMSGPGIATARRFGDMGEEFAAEVSRGLAALVGSTAGPDSSSVGMADFIRTLTNTMRDAVRIVNTGIQGVIAAIHRMLPAFHAAGRLAGTAFDMGMAAGILASVGLITSAAARAGAMAMAAFLARLGGGGTVGPEGPDSPTASDRSGGMGGNVGSGWGGGTVGNFAPAWGGSNLVAAGAGGYGISVTVNLGGVTINDQMDAGLLGDYIARTVADRLR